MAIQYYNVDVADSDFPLTRYSYCILYILYLLLYCVGYFDIIFMSILKKKKSHNPYR